jgi:hypothetical protein
VNIEAAFNVLLRAALAHRSALQEPGERRGDGYELRPGTDAVASGSVVNLPRWRHA